MNTLIQKLAGTDVALLVVPGGTANDLATTLGSNTSVKRIVQTIRENAQKRIDLVNINVVSATQWWDRFCCRSSKRN